MNHAKDLRPRIRGRADEVELRLRATLRCDRSWAKDVVSPLDPEIHGTAGVSAVRRNFGFPRGESGEFRRHGYG